MILYRGDYEKIDEFDVDMTRKDCLLGKGVYLTVSREVATTYRNKTNNKRKYQASKNDGSDTGEIFRGYVNTIQEAYAGAIFGLAYYISADGRLGTKKVSFPNQKREFSREHMAHAARAWSYLIRDKDFTVTRESVRVPKADQKYNPREASFLRLEYEFKTQYVIVYKAAVYNGTGHLTVLEMDKDFLDKNTIDADQNVDYLDNGITDLVGTEILKPSNGNSRYSLTKMPVPEEKVLQIREGKARLTSYFLGERKLSLMDLVCRGAINPNRFREVFEPYGFVGLRHMGGLVTGGVRHRVYILWDDALVNKSIVRREK